MINTNYVITGSSALALISQEITSRFLSLRINKFINLQSWRAYKQRFSPEVNCIKFQSISLVSRVGTRVLERFQTNYKNVYLFLRNQIGEVSASIYKRHSLMFQEI